MEQCPKCSHKYAKKPLKDENGKLIWKNLIYMDTITIIMVIAVICILIGTKQMIDERKEIFSAPCDWCAEIGCGVNILHQNYTEDNVPKLTLDNLKPLPLI